MEMNVHYTSMLFGKLFFDKYVNRSGLKIVDIGAQDVNGSLRDVAPNNCEYIGVDFVEAKGVDIVISDPYSLPFEDGSIDVCVCSSCFEHSEHFWLLFEEIMRILKDDGVFYLNVPSNGQFHRYPVDCWRFYPDSGVALQNWGRRKGLSTVLLESFTGKQKKDIWNDFVAVFLKSESFSPQYQKRIMESYLEFTNGWSYPDSTLRNFVDLPEDARRWSIGKIVGRIGYYIGAVKAKLTGDYRIKI
jgi:SAM-dependent methyltransferase